MIGMKILMDGHQATQKRLQFIVGRMESSIHKAAGQEAHLLRTGIVKGIRAQRPGGKPFKPLADSTKAARKGGGSSKALIDDGDLIRSIKVLPLFGGEAYFVGVHKMAVDKKGNELANIAEVHEFGTKDGRIPARPFLRPSFQAWSKGIESRMLARLLKIIGWSKLAAMGQGAAGKVLTDSMAQASAQAGKEKGSFSGEVNINYSGGNVKFKV